MLIAAVTAGSSNLKPFSRNLLKHTNGPIIKGCINEAWNKQIKIKILYVNTL